MSDDSKVPPHIFAFHQNQASFVIDPSSVPTPGEILLVFIILGARLFKLTFIPSGEFFS
jgi:hypothetical protein